MDYEKKYKEALERAREWYNKTEPDSYTCIVESIFPELKESEEERIRKELITHCRNTRCVTEEEGAERIAKWIAWLEKQTETDKASYEIAEKEKDDFVSGQFIECRKSFNEFKENNSYWFEYVGNDTYIGRSDNILNKKFHITPRQLYRLFTQQHCPKEKFDFDKKELKKVEPKFNIGDTIKYVGERKELAADKYTIKEICNDCYITTCGSKIPFRMQEYYVIVNDTKGLKKIETSLPSFDEQQGTPVIVHNKEHCQNAAWSEEDENNLTDTCIAIRKFYHRNNGAQDLIDWLQSLKERMIWKPTKEQIIALRWVLNNIPYNTHKEEISGLLEQIKDL